MSTTLTIEKKIAPSPGKTGKMRPPAVKSGDTFYTVSDQDFARLIEGRTYEVETESKTNGQYTNHYLKLLKEGAPVSPATNGHAPLSSKDVSIVRQCCLKAAAEYGATVGQSVDEVLATADRFVSWVNGTDGEDDPFEGE